MHPGYELDWNLVRSFAAVAKAGSLTQAADHLGVSHPTVTRHIHALETTLNVALFDRTQRGLTLNHAGERLVPIAEAMHGQALQFAALTDEVTHPTRCTVRVTASEFLGAVLPDILESLQQDADLTVELIPSDRDLNLLERDADIALRHGPPQQQDLICRKLGWLPLHLWASTGYVDDHGMPNGVDVINEHRYVVDAEGRMVKRAGDLGFVIDDAQIGMRCSTRDAEISAMRAGWGIGVLPELLARRYPELVRVFHDVHIPPVPVWLVARPELKHTGASRKVFDALANNLTGHLLPIE